MEHDELQAVIEALVFVSAEPLTVNAMHLILGEAGLEKAAIRQAVDALKERYAQDAGSGLQLTDVSGGLQFRTKPSVASWVQKLNLPKPVKLSQAAMETLSIVAYRQPLVRAEVEEIRGVDCGGVLKTLLERHLLRIVGKRDEPGSPLLYGTTNEFLSVFSLKNLSALPSLKEYHELEHGVSIPAVQGEAAAEADAAADPIEPIDAETQVAMETADQGAIAELEQQMRSLRGIENQIFPPEKPADPMDIIAAELSAAEDDAVAPVVGDTDTDDGAVDLGTN